MPLLPFFRDQKQKYQNRVRSTSSTSPFLDETRKHWKSHRKDSFQQQIFRYVSNEQRVLGNYLSLGQISLAIVNCTICCWSLVNTYSLVWLSSTCKHFFHFLWTSQKTQHPETPKKLRSLKLLKMGPRCLRIDFFFPDEKPGHSKVGFFKIFTLLYADLCLVQFWENSEAT